MPQDSSVRCCIAGGGPAGVMLGYLLARAGIEVAVLEKWPDFFRDFRGDTIHPSTMELLSELGLLEKFLALPHDETKILTGLVGDDEVRLVDFTHLPVRCPFVAFIPQWDFLKFLSAEAKNFPGFHLYMETEAVDLLEENGRVTGVKAQTRGEPWSIRAELTVGADGRHSTVREKGGLAVEELGAPIDVLWFSLSRKTSDISHSLGRIDDGRMMVLLDRTTYWQCGFIIRKGDFEGIRKEGIDAFRSSLAALAPFLADRVTEIDDWKKVKLLTVTVDHLRQWSRPGLLCIGDSAHAMSPIGGVGINYAIQDAVAAARILIPAFRTGTPAPGDLRRVERRRRFPTLMMQRLQVFIQNRIIARVLGSRGKIRLPWQFKLFNRFPLLRRIPARIIGMGFRTEHVDAALLDGRKKAQKGV